MESASECNVSKRFLYYEYLCSLTYISTLLCDIKLNIKIPRLFHCSGIKLFGISSLYSRLLNTADVMCGTRRNLTLVQLFTILEEKKRRGLGWHELHLVSSPFQLFLLPICYSKSDLSYSFFCNSATTLKVSHDFPKLAIIPSCTRINNHWFQTVLGALGVLKRTKLRALLPCVNFKVDVSLKGTLVGD